MAQFDVDAINVESLRQRTSVKWRTFDPDVLPAWVAAVSYTHLTLPTSDLV